MKTILFILILLLAVPCNSFAEKVFKHSTNAAPRTLAPLKSADLYANEIITAIYDTLYEYKYLAYNALYEKTSTMQPGPERAEIYKKMNVILLDHDLFE